MPFIAFQNSTPTEFEQKTSEKSIMKKYASLPAFLIAVFFDSLIIFFQKVLFCFLKFCLYKKYNKKYN